MTTKTQLVDSNGHIIQRVMRPSTTQKLATGAVSTTYSHGDIVRVTVDADTHVIVGNTSTGTATTSDVFISDGIVEYFKMEGTYLFIAGVGGNTYCTLMV